MKNTLGLATWDVKMNLINEYYETNDIRGMFLKYKDYKDSYTESPENFLSSIKHWESKRDERLKAEIERKEK